MAELIALHAGIQPDRGDDWLFVVKNEEMSFEVIVMLAPGIVPRSLSIKTDKADALKHAYWIASELGIRKIYTVGLEYLQ